MSVGVCACVSVCANVRMFILEHKPECVSESQRDGLDCWKGLRAWGKY